MSRMDAEIVADGDGAAVIAKLLELGGFELEINHWRGLRANRGGLAQ